MIFRKADVKDIWQLVELRKKQLIDEGCYQKIKIDKELTRYFKESIENRELICWVAVENEMIIATSGVCFYRLPPSYSNPTGRVAYVTNIYTKDEYRKQGIATKLLDYVMKEIKRLDYQVVRLHASKQGKSIYEKQGFSEIFGFMSMKI